MDARKVENLFDNISKRYDIANFFTSLGIERYWRKKFSRYISGSERCILDACCGTGFSTFNIINKVKEKDSRIFGVDFSEEMLEVAGKRLAKINLKSRKRVSPEIKFLQDDVLDLKFTENYFDLITIVFGIRNVANREQALKEFLRVAKPEARLVIMEFNYPENQIFRKIYSFYMNKILINIGGLITRNREAYSYLVRTIRNFPAVDEFSDLIKSAGWTDVKAQKMTFGTCTIFSAVKK